MVAGGSGGLFGDGGHTVGFNRFGGGSVSLVRGIFGRAVGLLLLLARFLGSVISIQGALGGLLSEVVVAFGLSGPLSCVSSGRHGLSVSGDLGCLGFIRSDMGSFSLLGGVGCLCVGLSCFSLVCRDIGVVLLLNKLTL